MLCRTGHEHAFYVSTIRSLFGTLSLSLLFLPTWSKELLMNALVLCVGSSQRCGTCFGAEVFRYLDLLNPMPYAPCIVFKLVAWR